MRTRNVVAAVIAVAAIALVAGSVALAAGHGPHGMAGMQGPGMCGMGGGLGLPLHRLDLTDEQREAIRAIVDAEQPALHALREKIRESRQAFMDSHSPTEFDEAAIRAYAAEQAPLLADLEVAEARVRAKALAVLTPEQVTELKTLRSQMHERMGEHREQRRGR
jgi:Spy/CpxP family protein refolding chaperone